MSKNKIILPTKSDISDDDISNFTFGKDELNIAEFPLSLTSNKRTSQKTIEFEDTVFDKFKNELITRKLIITGSDKYGLPTSKDAEIIEGLIQLSAIEGFNNRKISFSRYQLINLFGWKHTGYYYKRVTESLNRWLGVTLYYKNAWKDPETQRWMPKKDFHIIDNVEFFDPKDDESPEICSATWNEVVFESMQKGNLKNLNFNLYKSIPTPTSKRMFLFLDKRFHVRRKQEFDLKNFAINKVGIPDKYTTSQIKREINKASKELEKIGFLSPLQQNVRYKKTGRAKWKVFFEKGVIPKQTQGNYEKITDEQTEIDFSSSKPKHAQGNLFDEVKSAPRKAPLPNLDEKQEAIFKKLVARKVSEKKAGELASKFAYEFLDEKIEVLDSMKQKNFRLGNQAGYLIKSIEEGWQPPEAIKTRYQQQREHTARKEKELKRQLKQKEKEKLEEERRQADQKRWDDNFSKVEAYLEKIPNKEREDKIKGLVAKSDSFTRDLINKFLADRTKKGFGKACYEGLLLDNFLHLVDEKAGAERKAKKQRA